MRYYYNIVIVFMLANALACHGEDAVMKSAEASMLETNRYYIAAKSAKAKMAAEDYAGAIVELDGIIAGYEGIRDHLYRMRATCLYKQNEFLEAEMYYRKILHKSKNGDIECMIGTCLYEQNKYNEAYKYFNLALEKVSKSLPSKNTKLKNLRFQCKYGQASALLGMKHKEEAIQLFLAIRREFPDEDMTEIMEYIENQKKAGKPPASTTSSP